MLLPFVVALASPSPGPDPAERFVEKVFGRPTFASRRQVYAEASRSGRISVREPSPGRKFVQISGPSSYDKSQPESLFKFDFHPKGWLTIFTARDVRFSGDLYTINRPAAESELARIREYVRDLTGETCTVELDASTVDVSGFPSAWYRAFPIHRGRLVRREAAFIGTRGTSMALTDYSQLTPPEFLRDLEFVERPILDRVILQRKARAACVDHLHRIPSDVAWYFVQSEGLEFDSLSMISIPGDLPGAEEDQRTFLPVYRRTECYANGNFDIVAIIDAQNGRPRRVWDDRGRLGGGSRPVLPKTPKRITIGKVTSVVIPLPGHSMNPAGHIREIPVGAYVFLARHEPESRTLWLCTDPKVGYHPFEISEALNRTLSRDAAIGAMKR